MAAETRVNEVVGNNGLHTYRCGHTHLEFVSTLSDVMQEVYTLQECDGVT